MSDSTDPLTGAPMEEVTSDVPGGTVVDLLSLEPAALQAFVEGLGEQSFRARQVFKWLHVQRVRTFDAMTDLSRALRALLAERAAIRSPVVEDVRVAQDGTRKFQLRTWDDHIIEAVYIPDASGPGKNALCISSQVGCAMGCTFCATAALKLKRHLTPGEIVGQVYAVIDHLEAAIASPADPAEAPRATASDAFSGDDENDDDEVAGASQPGDAPRRRIQNIVFMGMGEPLHNIDGVLASIRLLTAAQGQGMSPRRITVSTSGIVPAIARLGAESGVHLAISLNASNDDVRAAIMPVDKRWNIAALLDACRAFPLDGRRRITFEYVLLKDVNDTDDDAKRLVGLLRGMDAKVNLIPFNAHPLSPFQRPSAARVAAFQVILERARMRVFVRSTRGLDIDAACGMLGAQKLETARKAAGLRVL